MLTWASDLQLSLVRSFDLSTHLIYPYRIDADSSCTTPDTLSWAIHESLPGIEVTIQVNGVPLQEYKVENERVQHADAKVSRYQEAWTTTSYIESTTNKTFTVNMKVRPSYKLDSPLLSFVVHVDSKWIHGLLLAKPTKRNGRLARDWTEVVAGVDFPDGPRTTTRQLKFAEIASSTHANAGGRVSWGILLIAL